MKDLLKELDKLSHAIDKQLRETVDDLAKEALKDVELAIAMTQTVKENSVEVQNYRIDIVEHEFAGRKKKFYNIIDTEINETLQEELGLFETALAMTKAYILGKVNTIAELETHDMEYCNALYEVYMHKSKTHLSEDISLAKIDNATRKLKEAKQKIIRKL
jgi:hypothetical protein